MADADRPTLTVEEREERGSRSVRRLRRSGYVPGVVYGTGVEEPLTFKVGTRELRVALQNALAVIDLKIGSQNARPVILKDAQRHPVRAEVMHVDLLQVDLRQTIQSTVPLELVGIEEAPGVVEGGVLEQVTRELNIDALPGDIPESIQADVSRMEIAGTMSVADLTMPEGVTILDDPEETVATITPPTELEETDAVEEETERVGEEAESAEPAEGGSEGESS